MNFDLFDLLLAIAPPSSNGGQGAPPWYVQLFPLVLIVVVFYFALIRPQQTKAKQHAQLLKTLRRGDRVVVAGGIIGIVVGVKEKTITFKSEDAKLEVVKSAVNEVLERSSDASES